MISENNKIEYVYKLEGVDPEDGVDIFEIAPILMSFGELVKSSAEVLGYDKKINVKVKPFREGSWITDFIFQPDSPVNSLLNYLKETDGQDLMLLFSFLGINVKEGVVGVMNILRYTKGKVTDFHKKDNGKIEYTMPDGGKFEVTLEEHRLVQSPLVQVSYYNSVIIPLKRFPDANRVSIYKGTEGNGLEVTQQDVEIFETYMGETLLEDVEENVQKLPNVYIKPKRGSYSGEEKAYSFFMGESILYPTSIEDVGLLAKLKDGSLRLFHEDVLKVDIEIRQKKDYQNKILNNYVITNLIEYIEFKKPQQISFDDKNNDDK